MQGPVQVKSGWRQGQRGRLIKIKTTDHLWFHLARIQYIWNTVYCIGVYANPPPRLCGEEYFTSRAHST